MHIIRQLQYSVVSAVMELYSKGSGRMGQDSPLLGRLRESFIGRTLELTVAEV